MSELPGELHPRLLKAHAELHATDPYIEALRLTDSGQFAAAIPHGQRSTVKNFIELSLVHFHDLGFRHGLQGNPGGAENCLLALDSTEGAGMRQRFEAILHRLNDEFRKLHREAETRWKQADSRDPKKQTLFREMNDQRRSLSKSMSFDRVGFTARFMELVHATFHLGVERGLAIYMANDRKRRLGLQVDHIEVPIKLYVDSEAEGGTPAPGDASIHSRPEHVFRPGREFH